nr:amino acid permease [Fodinicola feengrottensis]
MPDPTSTDTDDLAGFGYHQRLSRTLGSFSSFAAGFSYISILTGMFQLFGFGYGFGGPGLFWTWLFVLAGQFAVALCFAELGARFPIAGSVYQWSKQLAGRAGAWMAGWAMLVGSIVTVAAVSIALQIVLPPIWSGFQVFTDNTVNAVFLGCCLLIVTTIINILGVKVISRVNNIGVFVDWSARSPSSCCCCSLPAAARMSCCTPKTLVRGSPATVFSAMGRHLSSRSSCRRT